MGTVSRAAVPVMVLAAALLAGCGGSVTDADKPDRRPAAQASVSPFCAAAQANSDAIRPLNGMVARGTTPEQLSGTVQAVRRAGANLLAAAPDEIRPDVERTVGAVNMQLDVLMANGGDAAAVSRDPEVSAALSAPELTEASNRYRTYVARVCDGS